MRTTVKLPLRKKKQRDKILNQKTKIKRNKRKEAKWKDSYFIKNKNRHYVINTEKSSKIKKFLNQKAKQK